MKQVKEVKQFSTEDAAREYPRSGDEKIYRVGDLYYVADSAAAARVAHSKAAGVECVLLTDARFTGSVDKVAAAAAKLSPEDRERLKASLS